MPILFCFPFFNLLEIMPCFIKWSGPLYTVIYWKSHRVLCMKSSYTIENFGWLLKQHHLGNSKMNAILICDKAWLQQKKLNMSLHFFFFLCVWKNEWKIIFRVLYEKVEPRARNLCFKYLLLILRYSCYVKWNAFPNFGEWSIRCS